MKTSESIKNLTKALLQAQMKMGAAVKGSKNPFFKSNYADLPTVMEVVKEPLNESGILILQPPLHRDGKNFIETSLFHAETGEFMTCEIEVICVKQNDPQAFGAAQTYARRFSLQAMGFIPSLDDDGNTASNRTPPTYTKPTPSVVPAPSMVAAAKEVIAIAKGMVESVGTTTTEVVKTSSFRKSAKPASPQTKVVDTETQSDIWS